MQRVGHAEHPALGPGRATVGLEVAADREVPVDQAGVAEQPAGPLGGPALDEAGGVDGAGTVGSVGGEGTPAGVLEPGAGVEHVDDLGRAVEKVELAPVDPADLAVGPEGGEERLQAVELGRHRAGRGHQHLPVHVVVHVEAGHRAHAPVDRSERAPADDVHAQALSSADWSDFL